MRMAGRINQYDAVGVEQALVPFNEDTQITAIPEGQPGAAVGQDVPAGRLGRVGTRTDQHKIVLHHGMTTHAEPFGNEFFLCRLLFQENGEWCVRPTGMQGSGILSSMALADCFIVLEPEREKVGAGETVQVQLMSGLV